jgi:hypothetical protein
VSLENLIISMRKNLRLSRRASKEDSSPLNRWNEVEANEQGEGECESYGVDVKPGSFARCGCTIRHF